MADSFNEEMVDDAPATGTTATAGVADDVGMTETAAGAANDGSELPFAEGVPVEEAAAVPARTTFLQYLASPPVTLLIGSGESETTLTAHQGLLPRQIELPGEDLEAMGCFREFLYTSDYFPKKVPGQRTLEKDPSIPDVDMTGEQLLKHAKVYTLAEKFGLTDLKNLASSKIHCVNSTAKGEIAYARYVYEYTSREDTAIRVPVANFWATRSHTLRAEAEEEFRTLCLEFPQFGYDVLSMFPGEPLLDVCLLRSANLWPPLPLTARVLDEKLKRERNEKMHPGAPGSARKRSRHSSTAA
ncbi:hypothetical protein CHGG_03520 [Chaetomium globosum CBS 148.51]|uniref:BTB domain-containing protein n=1 Tax=Chaetomium globosum (strain ATCC 6205 / CBS 148.51 / DSM 1962 / NBRC 6347 / NRRL 1970) TaxID=306901 RepID=Q2H8D4_CHAGB|nr:uncharacterized protein CHGG_03520 [Chaetomium globosum CBS 148.51]EAQ91585.1 hypothetical protein CHGG_03520 [Chaetomium globosum CBS 148.51]